MAQKKYLLAGLFLLVLGMALLLHTIRKENNKENQLSQKVQREIPSFVDAADERTLWSQQIDAVGAEDAYSEFKQKYSQSSFDVQHLAAHIFGELLYEKGGVGGLTVCDSSFAFGCYHSFFGKAISQGGIDMIKELDKKCVEKYGPLGTGCQHGIGHGLLEYVGHSELVKALSGCTMTTQLKELLGCTSGVFMEYNLPVTVSAKSLTGVRKLNHDNPYEPCNTIVPDRFRKSCYYELAQWWEQVMQRDYKKMGILCKGITPSSYQEYCLLGLGYVVAPANRYAVAETLLACKSMPDMDSETVCRAGAAWSFFAAPEKRSLASALCKGLEPDKEQYCIEKSDFAGTHAQ